MVVQGTDLAASTARAVPGRVTLLVTPPTEPTPSSRAPARDRRAAPQRTLPPTGSDPAPGPPPTRAETHRDSLPTHDTSAAVDRLPRADFLVIALLLGSAFVVILNETTMSVALAPLMADLGITASTGQWLTTAFMLTMAVVIPATGFLLQRLGTRGAYLLAMSLFSAGTLLAALSPASRGCSSGASSRRRAPPS